MSISLQSESTKSGRADPNIREYHCLKAMFPALKRSGETGDIMTLNASTEEIKEQSDACIPLSNQIIQLAEDFNFDGISKLADELVS